MLLQPSPDWRLCHVEALCHKLGLRFAPPQAAARHACVSHPCHARILTVPADRPIQAVFIRALIVLALESGGHVDDA